MARSRHGAHSVTPVIDWLLVAALGYQTKMAPAVGCKMRWPLEGVLATAQKSLQRGGVDSAVESTTWTASTPCMQSLEQF